MRALGIVLVFGLLVGCDDTGVVQPSDNGSSIDAAKDTSAPIDAGQPDTSQPDMAEPDMAVADAGAPSTCEPGDGCFGEPCTATDDCLSGICTMHLGDKVCSKTCDEACPQGFSCTLVGSGGDGQYVCMSKFSHLCLPCSDAGTCSGETPNACVKYADGTRFCGGACDLETPCPSGYACQEVETADGANSYQCVNTAGACPCSNLAIDSALATPCESTNDQGSCEGVRICEESGLSECSAIEPAAESCNGIDDDCNGLTDENTCDDGNDCTVDTCEGEGGCKHEPMNEGECLDGDVCTIADHCEEGVCVGTPVDCNDDNPCTVDSCDGLGGCAFENIVAVCDDGDPCTLGDICQDGECMGSASLTCDDGNPCTDDSCGEAGCLYEANEVGCDDGNACTSGDVCAQGACKGSQVACDDDNLCTTDSCDITSGCVNTNNAQPCDDGDGCTQGDGCADGACTSGAATTCDDGNPCTDDACDGKLGCVFSPNGIDCDDKNSCTTGDSCVEGNCIGLGDLSCDDGNPCTEDACLADGGCSHTNVVGLCSDGDACTASDTCVDGACVSGLPISCDDGNPCTDEACDGGDCVFTANASECDDGNACTSASNCLDGACAASKSVDCDDKNACTSDACDPQSGCVNTNNVLQCTDADPCTIGDGCVDGSCQPGAGNLPCDDGNPCTDDSCQKGVGCVFTPNNSDCDDGNLCTSASVCKDGLCQATEGVVCDDNNSCTDDSCDVLKGCVYASNQASCDDGEPCTLEDVCVDGDCEGGTPLKCDDNLPCTTDSCSLQGDCLHVPDDSVCDDNNPCTTDLCSLQTGCNNPSVADNTPCGENGFTCQQGECKDKAECEGGWAYKGKCWYEGPTMSDGNCPSCDVICQPHGGCHEPLLVSEGFDKSCSLCKATACPNCGCQDGPGNVSAHEAAPLHNGSMCEYTDHDNYPPRCSSSWVPPLCNQEIWGKRRLCACNETP